jgi:ABC-type branched-subunit amino acid transport system substrate-binding protein
LAIAAALAAPAAGQAEATPGVTSNEIVFGNVSAFSGTSREIGREMKVGIETVFKAVNEGGGIHGRTLKLLAVDHGDEPDKAASAVKDLTDNKKVFAFVGNTGSAAVEAYFNDLMDKQVVLYGSHSGGSFLRNAPPDRYVFNFRASDMEEAAAAVRYLMAVRRFTPSEIAFFGQDDAYGDDGWKGLAWQMRRLNRDSTQVIRTRFKRNSLDVSEALQRIQEAQGVKAVVCFGTHKPVAKLIERLQGRGLVFTAASAVQAQDLADDLGALGPQFMKDVILTQGTPQPTLRMPVVQKYQEQLKHYFPNERPDFVSFQGWLATQVLVEALRRAGKDLDSERLVDALESIQSFDLGIGVPVSFGPSEHQASHKVWGLLLQPNGTWNAITME